MYYEKSSRHELMEFIAEMYYIQKKSQQEIANKLGMSRSNISKILQTCIDEEIVEFKINYRSSSKLTLEKSLMEKYKLKKVIISDYNAHGEINKINVGKCAGIYLDTIIQDGMLLGISWGTTLYYAVDNLSVSTTKCVDVIQMVGGLGAKRIDTDGQELAKRLSKIYNGNCYILQAPMIVNSKMLKDLLLQEPQIIEHFDLYKKIDIALIGLGSNKPNLSAVRKSGYITKSEAGQIIKKGAVSDICGHHVDIMGRPSITNISDRIIGITLEQLKNVPVIIGVAAGNEKKEAVLGALRGSYINVLVIDEMLAHNILNSDEA
jgi:deoxyribonucleoside regulator